MNNSANLNKPLIISTTLAYKKRSETRQDLPFLKDLSETAKQFFSKSERRKYYHKQQTNPKISASNYSVFDQSTSRFICGFNDKQPREIASLTKIMTCYLSIILLSRFSDQTSLNSVIEISEKAAKASGTSANLKQGDLVSIKSLLYGLMLPSGNDASIALSEHFGGLIFPSTTKPQKRFVIEMNKLALELGLPSTNFSNPHGLMHRKNLSSARDICKLASCALKNDLFREIVNTQTYVCEVVGKDGFLRFSQWKNTNKLLGKGFSGVKTGVTFSAGPCLCVSICREVNAVIVLLNCKSMEDRWVDAKKLSDWVLSKYYFQ